MNRVKELLADWSRQAQVHPLVHSVTIELNATDFARLRALTDLYKERTQTQILSELTSAMLDEIEEALPYIPGKTIISEDEYGDPVYEDIGLSRKFEQLVHKYCKTPA